MMHVKTDVYHLLNFVVVLQHFVTMNVLYFAILVNYAKCRLC